MSWREDSARSSVNLLRVTQQQRARKHSTAGAYDANTAPLNRKASTVKMRSTMPCIYIFACIRTSVFILLVTFCIYLFICIESTQNVKRSTDSMTPMARSKKLTTALSEWQHTS
jgi:hypothetical protein